MKKGIVVVDADQNQCRRLCALLKKSQYSTISMHSIQYLEENLKQSNSLAVIIDIDTISVNNRTVRELTIKFPDVYFFCLSEQSFHPELKDAICYHIYACLNKPIDPDELFYFLRSINENETDPNNQFAV
jgi:DNA-binding NtrC family response regulator